MLRKTGLGMLALFSTSSFAGFYIGGAIGPEGAQFKQKAHVTRAGTFNVIDTNHLSGVGGFASILGGYERRYNRWYLAGELNANISSVEYYLSNREFIHNNVSKTSMRVNPSVGISLLPGYFLSESTLLFGRGGYAHGKIKISEADPTIQSAHKGRNGVRFGLGLQHYLTTNLAFRMEYSQIHYKNIKGVVFEPFGGVYKDTTITPATAQVAFGLVYNFDKPVPVK